MADRSRIEWTDATWNPIRARNRVTGKTGWHCEHLSPGCAKCYAEGFNLRLGTGLPFKPGHRADVEIYLDETMLLQPLRWTRPRLIFSGSMTDLFADFVTDAMLDRIFALMALCPQHTFQVLTKRSARMRAYLSTKGKEGAENRIRYCAEFTTPDGFAFPAWPRPWPLPNVWLGVSAEDQTRWDERRADLYSTPAAVRFASFEPLLGPIVDPGSFANLDLAIVGGESGPRARPMHPDWARLIRDSCAAAGVAFFFKQWGEWTPGITALAAKPGRFALSWPHDPTRWVYLDAGPRQFTMFGAEGRMTRVGKKAAGRILDGVEHNGMPERHARELLAAPLARAS